MTLLLTEADVRSLLTMPIALEIVEESLRKQGNGELVLHPRRRVKLPDNALLHYMAAADPVRGYIGMKLYTVVRGVATKYLANANARTACIIGTGYQARTQLEAIAAVRRMERVRAFGRDPERREKFCSEMSERIGVAVDAASSGEEAVKGADIIITATSATKVVLEGAWLAPGMHINAMGANWPQKRELDAAAVDRADKIVVDFIEQSKMEAGDLIQAFGEDQSRWNAVQELSQIVAGKAPGRSNADQITLFKSNGIATWDLAAAVRVYEMAVARGVGKTIPLWETEKQA